MSKQQNKKKTCHLRLNMKSKDIGKKERIRKNTSHRQIDKQINF